MLRRRVIALQLREKRLVAATFTSAAAPENDDVRRAPAGEPTVIYQCPIDASQRVKLLSGCASAHAMYWFTFSSYQISTDGFFLHISNAPSIFDVTSPIWSYAGITLSAVFLGLARVYGLATLGEAALMQGDRLHVKAHSFFGNICSDAAPVQLKGFSEQPQIITLEYEGGNFHRIIDLQTTPRLYEPELLRLAIRASGRNSTAASRTLLALRQGGDSRPDGSNGKQKGKAKGKGSSGKSMAKRRGKYRK